VRRLRKVAIIGVGLIGGSFALALRRAGVVTQLVGVDRDGRALERAIALGVIDTTAQSPSEAAKGADLVFVSVPVRAMGSVLHDVALGIGPEGVITDAGSTKSDVVNTAREELKEHFPRFVAGHPIAGRESSGVEAAVHDLFRGARVVLSPVEETTDAAIELVRACWDAVGGRVSTLPAAVHDHIFAAVSHLPHMLAFALVSEIAARPDAAELLGYAAGGFRDFTRIAGSSPEMWRDIALNNRDALLAELDAYESRLAVFRELIARGDGPGLVRLMTEARNTRRAWAGGRRGTSKD
jgi:prephenate dehydrogenase